MDGIINVYKEAGFTSHDVVAKLRGILHQKKIGHTGTLDPDATGVLPICVGKATKVCELLTNEDKSYRAVCQLGVVTDTQDLSGEVLERHDPTAVTEQMLRDQVQAFQGEIMQVPPMYSALKVQGKKLYELAREGKTVERKARKITIKELTIVSVDLQSGTFTMDVTCSKGTYIRTLCHDIGQALGCGAAMASLLRTRVSIFSLDDAWKLTEIQEQMEQGSQSFLQSVDSLFGHLPGMRVVTEEGCKLLDNGNPLPEECLSQITDNDIGQKTEDPHIQTDAQSRQILVYDQTGKFRAIYEKKGRWYRVVKMF